MISVMIVDDEALARQRLQRMVEKISGYHMVAEAENGEQALHLIREHVPDIVLLDIRMPGMDGVTVAEQLVAMPRAPAVIFCTAYGEYSLKAFDVQALGYLLKPVQQDKLADALQRATKLSQAQLSALAELGSGAPPVPAAGQQQAGRQQAGRQHLSASHRGEVRLIPIEDVRVLNADQRYVSCYHLGGEALLEDSLKSLEQEFDQRFVRVHRNALVAIEAIEALERDGETYVLKVRDCTYRPQVSRRHLSSVRKLLQSL